MRKSIVLFFFLASLAVAANNPWQPAGDRIKTPWAEKVYPANPLP